MRIICFLVFIWATQGYAQDDPKTIHVFVALCDNLNQGIVPVPKALGDGQNPRTNLYWGALYGVKTHFTKSLDWEYIKTVATNDSKILERVLFKHQKTNTYLLAEAYDGQYIKQTTIDFLEAAAGCSSKAVVLGDLKLGFGGDSDLVSYIGHDGLMEFNVEGNFKPTRDKNTDAIMLACISKDYFEPYLKQTGANPLVWSTGLMSPEAYTLKWAIDGWILGESNESIRERAAQAYHHYQKCGIRGARNLLVTGY